MALEINSRNQPMVEADAKLWLTAEKDAVVPDGDERAAYLFCTPGSLVSRADAERYGMFKPVEPEVEEPTEAVDDSSEAKAEDAAEDKQAPTPANKQRRSPRADK